MGARASSANTASDNTATGFSALAANTVGANNTATGANALLSNTSGTFNTATGTAALLGNATGSGNTATGAAALAANTTGASNTANGIGALVTNTTGSSNAAYGASALLRNTTGGFNAANGNGALSSNTNGGFNTANGANSLSSNTTGNSNIALGSGAEARITTGSNNIDIGNSGVGGESNTVRIGNSDQTRTFITGIRGVAVSGSTVVVNTAGQLGVAASSKRFKDEIKPMDKASEAILALKPVSFRYKKELDAERILQFGLVAEDVARMNPDLVVRDAEGKIYTVRYDAVNAMLLNEFLKEHRKNEEQQATITALKSNDAKQEATIAQQQRQIEALSASLQKVSAQLEVSKSAPQTVLNSQ